MKGTIKSLLTFTKNFEREFHTINFSQQLGMVGKQVYPVIAPFECGLSHLQRELLKAHLKLSKKKGKSCCHSDGKQILNVDNWRGRRASATTQSNVAS